MKHCIVVTTCEKREDAEALAEKMVKKQLAACVQLSTIDSYYVWEDRLYRDPEIRLVIKTRWDRYDALEDFIKANHSYDVPQIVVLDIAGGSKAYLDWIDNTLHTEGNEAWRN
jgi:periplasmic divalent cation tolerance protein